MPAYTEPPRNKRLKANCQKCGRFVYDEAVGAVYDGWSGGYDIDPYCPPGKGCMKSER